MEIPEAVRQVACSAYLLAVETAYHQVVSQRLQVAGKGMAAYPWAVRRRAYLEGGMEACWEALRRGRPGACLGVGRGALLVLGRC